MLACLNSDIYVVKHVGWQQNNCKFEPYKGPSSLLKSTLSQIALWGLSLK